MRQRRLMKIKCKACKRKVKAVVLGSWTKMADDGNAYKRFTRVALLKHKTGIYSRDVCKGSDSKLVLPMGSFSI